MSKSYCSLGLMSGTSMDGVDASIIQSDGEKKYEVILDQYFKYPDRIYEKLTKLRSKITTPKDLKRHSKDLKKIESEITLFHKDVVKEIIKKSKADIDLIGFHGQTILHSPNFFFSKQLGDGKLLSKLIKKTVVYDFRQKDLKNNGGGAPLTPIFHKLIANKNKFRLPIAFLNLGGIANWTYIGKNNYSQDLQSSDAGPANCLIDQWMKKRANLRYDKNGKTASSGKINKHILEKAINNLINEFTLENGSKDSYFLTKNKTYDIKDFDLSFVNSLSLKDGAATLTEYTAVIISEFIKTMPRVKEIIVCGGGRENKFFLRQISNKIKYKLVPIDNYGINGDFVESQAFAYLAIRSYLKLPISFPGTTGCIKPTTGGVIIRN